MKIINKSILYSLPTSILFAIHINANLILKYGTNYANPILALLLLWLLSTCFIGLPIYLALNSKSKHKGWIVGLAVLCFLPFGTLLYFISLIWAIAAKFASTYQGNTQTQI
jgi:hypothetical protein